MMVKKSVLRMKDKLLYIVSCLLFIIDVITKLIINSSYSKTITIINNFFYINYVKNKGGAFGILEGNVFFIIIVTILIFFFIYKYVKNNELNLIQIWGYGLIMGGAIGNLYDRIIYGYVIDFLDFHFWGLPFPIFNVADCGIVIGCILILIASVKVESSGKVENKSK